MKKIWDQWELIAIDYLKRKWYIILDTNFKFWRFWEIDLIAKLLNITIFIEVKYRTNNAYWSWLVTLTKNKLFNNKKSIDYYCITNQIDFKFIQFDVIYIEKMIKTNRITHYKNQSLER